ncbi:MAG: DUF1573 domain-containing protein [Ignavibacteriales bacterium]|nr:MAG: DUF1573 domain-containing protein [Ignavibacteriales bacterium]
MIRKMFLSILLFTSFVFPQIVGPRVSVQLIEHNFGDIVQGQIGSHSFKISNVGGDILKILEVRPTCGCTAAQPDKKELTPGESTSIKVEFNSAGRLGVQEKYVLVKTNDEQNQEIRLKLKANVIKDGQVEKSLTMLPAIKFYDTQFDFGKVEEGKKVQHTFSFSNLGQGKLEIKDIVTSCGCTAALVSDKVLEPGQNGTLKVELDTSKRSGKMSRTVTVKTNDPKEPNKVLTIFAEVQKVNQ